MNERWDARPYCQRLGDALSQLVNVALANGMPDESLSGRSYRSTVLRARAGLPVKRRWRFVRAAAELLFWPLDRGRHAELAFWEDLRRCAWRAEAMKSCQWPPRLRGRIITAST